MSNLFNYDTKLVPDVRLESEWKLEDGFINQVYRAGNWSFETCEESDIEYAKSAIYAWIAWHDFLASSGHADSNE